MLRLCGLCRSCLNSGPRLSGRGLRFYSDQPQDEARGFALSQKIRRLFGKQPAQPAAPTPPPPVAPPEPELEAQSPEYKRLLNALSGSITSHAVNNVTPEQQSDAPKKPRPLPKRGAGSFDSDEIDKEKPPPGKMNRMMVAEMFSLRREDPATWTAEKLAERYGVELRLLELVLSHNETPIVVFNDETRQSVGHWPAAAPRGDERSQA
eukprot:TRINITY_DN22907_c0_g1_i1.p2 TRINITY_DN22907_c0_g1~~TRINITY_DN22907_c0_g1_i1.p2  ORF type:complete len:208 (-),score=35.57 TRINITY_DN22907_c0_g1_i1:321-944(-)